MIPPLSIIVPMLNEADQLPELLDHLRRLAQAGCEIVLVDGGSSDRSVALARQGGFTVLQAERGRARQMNAGAALAQGEVLLFLHADTRLPEGAERLIAHALQQGPEGGRVWGRFDVRIAGKAPLLRVIALLMNARSRFSGIATGDQAIFMRRPFYEAVGCFADQPLMEDIELSKRLKRYSPPACITRRATTSGRLWMTRGVWRTVWLMWRLRWDYWRGVPPQQLAERYR